MRFVFKTSYAQDLGLFRDGVQRNWYLALLVGLLGLPVLIPTYLVDVSLVLIYGLAGLSLMVLAGYTGLVSLGHAAFLGIGAYAHVYFAQTLGLPWVAAVGLAALLTAAAGVLVGLPALRMTGIYLTIATLAFALIIQEVFVQWEGVTGGLKGKPVDKPVIFGVAFSSDVAFYFLCVGVLMGGLWLTSNVLRSPTGRAWVAIRDSEIAAQSMGVNLAVYKTMAFAYSAGLMASPGRSSPTRWASWPPTSSACCSRSSSCSWSWSAASAACTARCSAPCSSRCCRWRSPRPGTRCPPGSARPPGCWARRPGTPSISASTGSSSSPGWSPGSSA